jgi:transcriptional regulator with XRE-family HTH domain
VDLTSVGARLKAFRESKGLTKYRLAKISGVSQTYIYRIERGEIENPRRDTLQKLAKGLSITLGELIGETAPLETWQLVERSLKAYVPIYAAVYEAGMEPIDHVVCTRARIPPPTVHGYRIGGLFLEPEILSNDTVIVDTNLSPVPGDLVMLAAREGAHGSRRAVIKRYREDKGGKKTVEDNDASYPLDSDGCYQGLCVYGVVMELVRKLR